MSKTRIWWPVTQNQFEDRLSAVAEPVEVYQCLEEGAFFSLWSIAADGGGMTLPANWIARVWDMPKHRLMLAPDRLQPGQPGADGRWRAWVPTRFELMLEDEPAPCPVLAAEATAPE